MHAAALSAEPDRFLERRHRMVDEQISARGIRNPAVLSAMRSIPRELFVPREGADSAYEDRALPIGLGQTISQPYIVAFMTDALVPAPGHRVLEIGTGSGYQTAVLAMLCGSVITIERIEELSHGARQRTRMLGLSNIEFFVGDGSCGWPERAPYDRIIVTAAAPGIIPCLAQQLAPGGRIIMPIGGENTQLVTLIEVYHARIVERPLLPVRFVKLIGKEGFSE